LADNCSKFQRIIPFLSGRDGFSVFLLFFGSTIQTRLQPLHMPLPMKDIDGVLAVLI